MLEIIDGRAGDLPVTVLRPRPIARVEAGAVVAETIADVRLRGDEAVLEHGARLDGVRLDAERLRVAEADIRKAPSLVRPELATALEVLAARVRAVAERRAAPGWEGHRDGDAAGEVVGELVRPLRRVGVHVPGGRPRPSTVLMAAVPARVAGVHGIAVATPPDGRGEVSEVVLAACAVAGIEEVYRMGGAHAIAALAYGTETVRPVDKVVGLGDGDVAEAKRRVRGWVGTDDEPGPHELAIVAGPGVSPDVLAADLVAHAEHGPLGLHVLVAWTEGLVADVLDAVARLVDAHERAEDVENALIEGGRAVLVRDLDHGLATVNALAPARVALFFEGARERLDDIYGAGAVFLGQGTPPAAGELAGGIAHLLPGGGAARWASGLSVGDFVRRVPVQDLGASGLEGLDPHVAALADAEGLPGHARSLRVRREGSR